MSTLITVDVYGRQGDRNPTYRVYVNNNLLTERDFIWPGNQVFVRENIEVNLRQGTHLLRVEHINRHGSIEIKNITVNGVASADQFTINE
jgi:hypothetical protein